MDGRKIKIMRITKGLSQDELSQLSGVDRTYISMIETGRKVPSLLVLGKIAKALDCKEKDFF